MLQYGLLGRHIEGSHAWGKLPHEVVAGLHHSLRLANVLGPLLLGMQLVSSEEARVKSHIHTFPKKVLINSPACLALGDQRGPNAGQLIVATFDARTGQDVVRKLKIVEGVLEGICSRVAVAKALI